MMEPQKGVPLNILVLVGAGLFIASAVTSYSIFILAKDNPLKVAQIETLTEQEDNQVPAGERAFPETEGEEFYADDVTPEEREENVFPDLEGSESGEEVAGGDMTASDPDSLPEAGSARGDIVSDQGARREMEAAQSVSAGEKVLAPEPAPAVRAEAKQETKTAVEQPVSRPQIPKEKVAEKKEPAPEAESESKREEIKIASREVKKPKFNLQVQIYSDRVALENDLNKINGFGLETFTREEMVKKKQFFLVLEGKMTPGEARANSLKLKVIHKIESEIVSLSDGTAQVKIGPFPSLEAAEEKRKVFQGSGLESRTDTKEQFHQKYILGAGPFYTAEELKEAEAVLRENGFNPKSQALE